MKLTYDPKHNIAYITLRPKVEQVETIRLSDEMNIDISADGKVYGIELLNANEQLRGGGADGAIVFVNERSGETSQINLPDAA